MLLESHPLYQAELFLLFIFEKAPPEHWIEFTAIESGDKKKDEEKIIHVEAVQVKDLERHFDLVGADWILKHNKNRFDTYFGVCPREKVRRTPKGYPMRARAGDVVVSVCAWMDYDKSTWKEVLVSDPKPSCAVATGHGGHFYYRYAESVPIGKAIDDSKAIAARYGGDSCWDPVRLLRIPGTRNWKEPDKEMMATLEMMEAEVIFSGKVDLTAPIKKAQTIMDLPWDLRNLILHGHSAAVDPYLKMDEETKEIDRSAVDYRAMASCFEYGFDEDKIRQIWSNPEYGISAKVTDEAKKGNAENYLRRTIDNAKLEYQKKSLKTDEIGDEVKFMTLHELAKVPPLEFAIGGLLPVGGLLTISGSAKVGKSFTALEAAMLLSGAPGKFLGHFEVNPRYKGPVVYCQAEISPSSLDFRVLKIGKIGLALEDFRDLPVLILNQHFDLGNPRHVVVMANSIRNAKARFLIVDPLARFHYRNENRQDEMSMILRNLQTIGKNADLMGTILLHHFGKPIEAQREGVHMIRGATVIGDWGNSHMLMHKKFNETTGKKYAVINFELRDAEEITPITMALNRETFRFEPYAPDGEHLPIAKEAILNEKLNAREKIDFVKDKTGLSKNEAGRLIAKTKKELEEGRAAAMEDEDAPSIAIPGDLDDEGPSEGA